MIRPPRWTVSLLVVGSYYSNIRFICVINPAAQILASSKDELPA